MNEYKLVVLSSTTCNKVRSGSVPQLQVARQQILYSKYVRVPTTMGDSNDSTEIVIGIS